MTRFRRRTAPNLLITVAAFALTAMAPSASVAVGPAQIRSFSIQAQPLGDALRAYAASAGLQAFFAEDDVAGRKNAPLNGSFTPQEAIHRLLDGTGLVASMTDDRTVVVKPAMAASSGETEAGSAAAIYESADIIVTAQKREERLMDVPMSIAAVGSEEINRRGFVSAEDYLRGIPGVNQVGDVTGSSIIIRGIETSPTAQNFSSGTTVATYFGETPTTNSGGLAGNMNVDIKLVDIERVEVLRGPQGTSFGNSSLGGAVRTIPVAPKTDRIEAKVAGSYSITQGTGGSNYMVQAIGNIPIVQDKIAIRATVYQFQDSGYYRNISASDPAFIAALTAYGAGTFVKNDDQQGKSKFTGGRISALIQPVEDLQITLGYLKQKTRLDGLSYSTVGGYDQLSSTLPSEHVMRGQDFGLQDTDIEIANATVNYDFGWASILANVSHVSSGTIYVQPWSPPSVPLSQRGDSSHREKTGELRLTTQLNGAWNFLVGAYAERLKDRALYDYVWYGDPALNFFGPGLRYPGDYLDERKLTQKAAFAEVSWKFLPRFTLTGGARYYDYKRNATVTTTGFFGVGVVPLNAKANGASYRANLSYKPNDDSLVYANWSQGFRLGKPQPGLPASVCDINPSDGIVDGTSNITIASTKELKSDKVDNYEFGGKFSLLDKRLQITADVFRIDWDGVPFRVNAPFAPNGCSLAYNANAGSARSEGIEFQANFYLARAIRMDVGGSYIKARLTEDAPGIGGFDGDRLPGSPRYNANLSLQYEFDIGGHNAFIRADSIYVGTFYGDVQKSPQFKSGGYVKLDTSARVALGNLNVDLFIRNVTNQDDFTFRGIFSRESSFGYRLRPRTFGLQLGYDF